jgi:hypothetical protein
MKKVNENMKKRGKAFKESIENLNTMLEIRFGRYGYDNPKIHIDFNDFKICNIINSKKICVYFLYRKGRNENTETLCHSEFTTHDKALDYCFDMFRCFEKLLDNNLLT